MKRIPQTDPTYAELISMQDWIPHAPMRRFRWAGPVLRPLAVLMLKVTERIFFERN